MPRKTDSIPINNPKNDKRVKLTDENKDAIREQHATGMYSINGLAREWKVSKRLIQFILFPERAERAKQLYAERRKDGRYYDKEKHRVATKAHRDHKKELDEQGLLKKEMESE